MHKYKTKEKLHVDLDLTAAVPMPDNRVSRLPADGEDLSIDGCQDRRFEILASLLKALREANCAFLAGPSLLVAEGICFVILDGYTFHLGHGATLLSAVNKAYVKWEKEALPDRRRTTTRS